MAFNYMYVIRGVQAFFAIIVLGCTGYLVDQYVWYGASQSQTNFLLFCSVWTLLALIYLTFTPRFAPSAAHPWFILGVDALTMLFWFAGFIALAVQLAKIPHGCDSSGSHFCTTSKAASAFGGLDWVLFLATTVLAGMGVLRGPSSRPSGTLGA